MQWSDCDGVAILINLETYRAMYRIIREYAF